MMAIARHKTAISRNQQSLPIKLALQDRIVNQSRSVFDYGCGKGGDVAFLKEQSIECTGWDPVHANGEKHAEADVVNLGYVINVIEKADERKETLQKAFSLAKRVLIVSVLLDTDSNKATCAVPHGDGIVTSRGTFQKFFTQSELKQYIKDVLGIEAVSAGLGVIYVFRDETEKQLFLATRVRRERSAQVEKAPQLEDRYGDAKRVLEKFVGAIEHLGRIPNEEEFESAGELKSRLSSFNRAFNLIKHVFPDHQIEERRQERVNDLLVYLALSRFQSRPQFSLLPQTLQYDMRAFFGSYTKALEQADKLLFLSGKSEAIDQACKESAFGKLLPKALYIHKNYLGQLSPVLRIYVGCAQVLVGEVENANIIKIHRNTGKVSYMVYGDFDKVAHPCLREAVTVFLRNLGIRKRSYVEAENPPLLHRKETFVLPDYPGFQKFAKFTEKEVKAGLLDEPLGIGFKQQWEARLAECGYKIRGHQLVKVKTAKAKKALVAR